MVGHFGSPCLEGVCKPTKARTYNMVKLNLKGEGEWRDPASSASAGVPYGGTGWHFGGKMDDRDFRYTCRNCAQTMLIKKSICMNTIIV